MTLDALMSVIKEDEAVEISDENDKIITPVNSYFRYYPYRNNRILSVTTNGQAKIFIKIKGTKE